MPSTSVKQRAFFNIVLAYKEGKKKESEVSKEVIDAANGMTIKEIKDYAHTTDEEMKKANENTSITSTAPVASTPINVNGIGSVKLPGDPDLSTNFSKQILGSGDILLNKKKKLKFIKTFNEFKTEYK